MQFKSIQSIINEVTMNRCMLVETTKVHNKTKGNVSLLRGEYKENEDSTALAQALVSILNSVITQQRIYFCSTRNSLDILKVGDQNFKINKQLSPKSYKLMVAVMCQHYFEVAREGNNKQPIIYKVKDPYLLSLITGDEKEQFEQCLEFVTKKEGNQLDEIEVEETEESTVPSVEVKKEEIEEKPLTMNDFQTEFGVK